jgi:stage II sporulation protein D
LHLAPGRHGDQRSRRVASGLPALAVACLVGVGAVLGAGSASAAGPVPVPSGGPAQPRQTPTPTPFATPPWPDEPTVLGSTVRFYGRGYGHGVGMSQYGARGRARDGQGTADILAHYYRGATLGTLDPAPAIRVLILSRLKRTKAKPLVIYGRRTEWSIDGIRRVFPPDARLTLTPTTKVTASGSKTTWRLRVVAASGRKLLSVAMPKPFTIRAADAGGRLQLWSKPTTYDQFRGTLRVLPRATKPTVSVVNRLGLELYLRGVVPAEMPSTWPAAALRAQAIASRSYAARKLRPGVSYYDTVDDSRSQVYRGSKAEHATTNDAIAATGSQVLRKGSSIANTMYHSAGGGATENNENVYTSETGKKVAGKVSYLRGSMDRRADGTAFDDASPFATWRMKTYTRATLSAWFAADPRTDVGDLTALDLTSRGVSGRLIKVTLIGSDGTKTVSSAVFRSILNAARPAGDPMMRSTLFDTKPVP